MKELYFNIGEETRPKIEEFENKEAYKKSFFYNIYQKAFQLIYDILSQSKKENITSESIHEINNIIAFVGDRGSGKTSCMETVYSVLKNNRFNLIADKEISYKFSVLPTIDPSYFEERNNLLEIVVSHMFEKFKKDISDPQINREKHSIDFLDLKNELIIKFQEVKNCLDTIHEKPKITNDSIESLSELAQGINLKNAISELITRYLKYFNADVLTIAIDDIDLQTRHIYKMVEQIRKYLFLPKVIILIGVKMSQLNDLLKQYYYQENETLINSVGLSDTTENMSGRYLSKLIPYNQRIIIPNIDYYFESKITIFYNNDIYSFSSIISGVLELIFAKTRYLFYNSDVKASLIIPHNLRDLLNLISLLFHMDSITDEEIDEITSKEKLKHNRLQFKDYFINTWCSENLSTKMYNFIKELETIEISNINKKIIDFLLKLENKENIHFETYVIYKGNRGYNMSLGDVDYILDKISNNYEIEHIHKFVFAIKTIYSFFLYQLFEEKEDDIEIRIKNLCLQYNINETAQQDKCLRNMTKMMVITNYEKLLGGNLLRVANIFSEPNSNENGEMILNYSHIRLLNSKTLKNLYNYLHQLPSHYTKLLQKFKNVGDDICFNIYEFFMLTTYLNTDNQFFRSQKRCYYISIPYNFPIDHDSPIVYSSTAILFNLVKFYNYCRLYYKIKKTSSEKFENNSWYKFWETITEKGNNSLIYQILYPPTINQGNKEEFENKNLESIFIRNLEVLDILQDYIPFLKSKVKNASTLNFRNIVNFYKKLSEFQFYLYPKYLQKNQTSTDTIKYNVISFEVLKPICNFLQNIENQSEAKNIFCDILFGKQDG